jgi:hypothetical protein
LDAKKSREGTGFKKPLTIAHHNHQQTSGGRFFYCPRMVGNWIGDHFSGQKKGARFSSNPLIFLVAGRGFEPLTFGL